MKILEYLKNFHWRTIDYVEHSRIKNKQCKWTEQCVDLFHLKQLSFLKVAHRTHWCTEGGADGATTPGTQSEVGIQRVKLQN